MAIDDELLEVYRQHRTSQDKYAYFLLAAAGAAIALAVNQTQHAELSVSQWPLGLAVLLWAFSFVCGCLQLHYRGLSLFANFGMLARGADKSLSGMLTSTALIAEMENSVVQHSNSATKFSRMQFYSLVAGAIFYLLWHIYEMWLRT